MIKSESNCCKQKKNDRKPCVYCNVNNHKSNECEKVKGIQELKKIPSEKKSCFNCASSDHRAPECKSRISRQICQRKHHTSVCDKNSYIMVTKSLVIHPVVLLKVNKIICRALLDASAGSYYASAALLDPLILKRIKKETKNIDMMMLMMS